MDFGELTAASPQPETFAEEQILVLQATLAANEEQKDLGVDLDNNCTFELLAISGQSTGDFSLNLKWPSGRYLATSYVDHDAIVGTGQFPVELLKPQVLQGGSKIGVDLRNDTNAENKVKLYFRGYKNLPRR
jgi:hypothetical protein